MLLLGGRIGLDAEQQLGATWDDLVQQWRTLGRAAARAGLGAALVRAHVGGARDARREERDAAALRVLLVDDDPTTRCMMEGVLSGALGHVDGCANNGREALALAVETQPQIVVTDWMMPGMDGWTSRVLCDATEWADHVPDHAHRA